MFTGRPRAILAELSSQQSLRSIHSFAVVEVWALHLIVVFFCLNCIAASDCICFALFFYFYVIFPFFWYSLCCVYVVFFSLSDSISDLRVLLSLIFK